MRLCTGAAYWSHQGYATKPLYTSATHCLLVGQVSTTTSTTWSRHTGTASYLPSNQKEPIISEMKPTRPFQGSSWWPFRTWHKTTWFLSTATLIAPTLSPWVMTPQPPTWSKLSGSHSSVLAVLTRARNSQQSYSASLRWGGAWTALHPHQDTPPTGKAEATVKSMKKIIRTLWNGLTSGWG